MTRLWLALFLTLCLGLAPARAQQSVIVPATMASVAITTSSASTVQLVPLKAGQSIYVTNWNVVAAGTTNVQLVYGTGTNCGTGQGNLTGAYQLIAQVGLVVGIGNGAVLVAPQGTAVCVVNSQAIAIPGSLSYAQF